MVTVKGNIAEFSFFRPKANQVHLAGEFNQWQVHQLPMMKTRDGHWTARLILPAGTFKFRYYADGQWFADYAAFGIEFGPFGPDSVVRVEAKKDLALATAVAGAGRWEPQGQERVA